MADNTTYRGLVSKVFVTITLSLLVMLLYFSLVSGNQAYAANDAKWDFRAFGQGATDKFEDDGYKVNDDGTVTVWSLNNKGKLVPASTDGLSFYYTTVPSNKNFTFTATATIESWTYTNGQEGFGIMAADTVGEHGKSSMFWNNSYMASGTKVEYYYDKAKGEVIQDESGERITMKDGLGAQEKIGVTKDNIERLKNVDVDAIVNEYSTHIYPLETSCGPLGKGTYNLFDLDNCKRDVDTSKLLTSVTLQIQKNNTGYFVSYLDDKGKILSQKKFYEPDALAQLDEDNIYVGVFASRAFKVVFSNIDLVLTDPEKDAPAEERPTEYVVPVYNILSAPHSNTAEYELVFSSNADGTLVITDPAGKEILNRNDVKANEIVKVDSMIEKGDNSYNLSFTPDPEFHPEGRAFKRLSSYDTQEFTHDVHFQTINDDENVYVAPDGKEDGAGSADDPVDIYTAFKYVQPGQTVVLKGGNYELSETVKVHMGIDGTEQKPIKVVNDGERAIFDFGTNCAGFNFGGDYWNISGIDCTRSKDALPGILLSGENITLEDARAYYNGNTGIQIARFANNFPRELWPRHILILNCVSYGNADAGYEDADGFAAKITCDEDIVFDGCIAYNNADDGWDLFSKVESGSIGPVTIQNCVSFANGMGLDGTDQGNGNGFKMGGASMAGSHKIINSATWGNKGKGIDSNSCPDIQVYHCTSFNNGINNVALYTNDAANTNFYVEGVMSFRNDGGKDENIKPKGSQDEEKIYGITNFFWKDEKSANSEDLQVDEGWFVSLDAPFANADDPIAVADSLRNANGNIDLGDFLKLSAKGEEALNAAGINPAAVVADLDGEYVTLSEPIDTVVEAAKENVDTADTADTVENAENAEDAENSIEPASENTDTAKGVPIGMIVVIVLALIGIIIALIVAMKRRNTNERSS